MLTDVEPKNKQEIVENILLQEANFSKIDVNALPLKIFSDLFLSGGIAFNVSSLFENNNYTWLMALLLNLKNLPSLSTFHELRRQLLIFVETEI